MVKTTFPVELQERFERALLAGQYASAEVLSCNTLATQFQTQPERMQLVLSASYRKGLVHRRSNGYVAQGMISAAFDSVFQHASKAGLKPCSDVRSVSAEPAGPASAARLDLKIGDPVYRLVRTRKVDDLVVANQINHIPYELCPGLESHDMSHRSFQMLMEEEFHVVFADRQETTAIVAATQSDAAVLDLCEGARMIRLERILYSVTEQPVVWSDFHLRADRCHFLASLWPAVAPLAEQIISG